MEELQSGLPEKTKVYLEFVNIFVETMQRARQKKNINDLSTRLLKAGLNLMILAPDNVVKKYTIWRSFAMEGGDMEGTVKAFGDVIIEMRKDIIGQTECKIDDVLDVFLKG